MVFKKKVTKAPAVRVETRKISTQDSCSSSCNCCATFKGVILFGLLVLNTLLMVFLLVQNSTIESERVWWKENYKMVKQIYKTDAFKTSQKQQIEQALQMYQWGLNSGIEQQMPMIQAEESIVE